MLSQGASGFKTKTQLKSARQYGGAVESGHKAVT